MVPLLSLLGIRTRLQRVRNGRRFTRYNSRNNHDISHNVSKRIYLVPDTNVLMQCRHLSELPWKEEFPGFDTITLVLIAPVLREVDRQKGGQGRLANRARKINSLIGQLLESPSVDISKDNSLPTVKLISRDELRPDSELHAYLDYAQADDAIVGTVSALAKACAGEPVKLLSNDNGVLLSSRRVEVPFHRVPAGWLLSSESDDDQKRIKDLEGEIKRLRKNEPICLIEAEELPWKFNVDRFEPLSELQIQDLLGMLKRDFPEETDFGSRERSTRSAAPGLHGLYAHFGQEEFIPATDSEISEYQQARYPQWIAACEELLRKLHSELEKATPALRGSVSLVNEGARPAEDVRVSFSVRGGGLLIKLPAEEDKPSSVELEGGAQLEVRLQDSRVGLPRPPNPPKGYWRKVKHFDAMERIASLSRTGLGFERLGSQFMELRRPILPMQREPDAFYWVLGTRPEHPRPHTELTCQQWRHRSTPKSFEFEIVWFGGVESRKGALYVEIHASNLPDPVTKAIPIEVIANTGNAWVEAEALIELLKKPAELCRPPQT